MSQNLKGGVKLEKKFWDKYNDKSKLKEVPIERFVNFTLSGTSGGLTVLHIVFWHLVTILNSRIPSSTDRHTECKKCFILSTSVGGCANWSCKNYY